MSINTPINKTPVQVAASLMGKKGGSKTRALYGDSDFYSRIAKEGNKKRWNRQKKIK